MISFSEIKEGDLIYYVDQINIVRLIVWEIDKPNQTCKTRAIANNVKIPLDIDILKTNCFDTLSEARYFAQSNIVHINPPSCPEGTLHLKLPDCGLVIRVQLLKLGFGMLYFDAVELVSTLHGSFSFPLFVINFDNMRTYRL